MYDSGKQNTDIYHGFILCSFGIHLFLSSEFTTQQTFSISSLAFYYQLTYGRRAKQ